jgi:hypothetical protein
MFIGLPFVTHDVVFEEEVAVKRFRRRAHDEPRREWQALNLLARASRLLEQLG